MKRLTFQEWVQRAREVHGLTYRYDADSYTTTQGKVRIKCDTHGWFEQVANAHTHQKSGCPKCSGKFVFSVQEFIAKARAAQGGRYDYSQIVSYKNQLQKLPIVCPKHGVFMQNSQKHLHGRGCPKCGNAARNVGRKLSHEQFLSRAIARFGNKYQYLSQYQHFHEKVLVRCTTCSTEFSVSPAKHLWDGTGCPRCANQLSHNEQALYEYVSSLVPARSRVGGVLHPLELDVLTADGKVAFEYDGLYWHSDKFPGAATRHLDKTLKAAAKGIRLIHVFEDEWLNRRSVVEKTLRHILGCADRLPGARTFTLAQRPVSEVVAFLEANHLQGAPSGGIAFCLDSAEGCVAVMTFSKVTSERGATNAGWELTRFATVGHIPGAASRLFSAFVAALSPTRVISYSDLRWFTGNMYATLGFEFSHNTRPNYWVCKDGVRLHKSNFRKARLQQRMGATYDATKTEKELCDQLGWFRVYDCGLSKWVWTPKSPT